MAASSIAYSVGDIVLLNFPFSDFSTGKLRPAIIVAESEYDDFILCQITSKNYGDREVVELPQDGLLGIASFVRIRKIFTASTTIFARKIGKLPAEKQVEISAKLKAVF
jgi:mRNA interferase MazF